MEALFRRGDISTVPEHFLLEQTVSGIKAKVVCLGNRERLKRADRTYEDLKQKQRAKITDSMFKKTCDYCKEHGKLLEGEDCERTAGQIYQRVKGIAGKASFDEMYSLYFYRLPCYEVWIAKNGIPERREEKKSDADKPKVKRRGISKKVCPNRDGKTKQQFIGLQYYKRNMSWEKDIGYSKRTGNMAFALERRRVGEETKQRPVIRCR